MICTSPACYCRLVKQVSATPDSISLAAPAGQQITLNPEGATFAAAPDQSSMTVRAQAMRLHHPVSEGMSSHGFAKWVTRHVCMQGRLWTAVHALLALVQTLAGLTGYEAYRESGLTLGGRIADWQCRSAV